MGARVKVFYLIRKIKEQWYKQEIGVCDWEIFVSEQSLIERVTKTKLVSYSEYGAYLLAL